MILMVVVVGGFAIVHLSISEKGRITLCSCRNLYGSGVKMFWPVGGDYF